MKAQIIDWNKSDLSPKKVALSFGGFDGIHLGHQALLKRLLDQAKQKNLPSCLCVFDPLPFQVLRGHSSFTRLFTIEEMKIFLKPLGLDFFCLIPFDIPFSKRKVGEFVSLIVKHFEPVHVLLGYDFSFAHQREGNFSVLKKLAPSLGFSVEQASVYLHENQPVSSSRIRQALSSADMESVKLLLGRPYSFTGKVLKGEGRGKKLGFPTANLQVKNKELPPLGVYGARIQVQNSWLKAVVNLGCRPTFSSENPVVILEVHIPSVNLNLYDQIIKVELDFFIRKERAFATVTDLKEAIRHDIEFLHTKSEKM